MPGTTPRTTPGTTKDTITAAERTQRAWRAGGREAAALPAARGSARARKTTLLLVGTLTIMSGATIAPALPAIEAWFEQTPDAALLTRLVLTIPAILIAFCAPLAGSLADRHGRRPLLIGSILLFGLAGMSGLAMESLYGLLAGRALLGVAVAGTMTAATALAGDYFSGPERDRFMGVQSAFVGLGGLVFLTGGGLLAELHWRAPFAVYGLAFALLPAAILFIVEPFRPGSGQPGSGRHPAQRETAGMRLPASVTALLAVAALNSAVFYLVPTQLPFYLGSLEIDAPSRAGFAIGLFQIPMAAMSLAYGWLRGRAGIMGMFGIGFGLMAAGFGLTAAAGSAAGSYTAVLAGMAVTGAGMGAVMPNLMVGAISSAPPSMRGRVSGGLTASIFLGQFLSPLLSQPWIAAFGFAAAFRDAGLLLAGLAVGAGLLAAGSMKRRQRDAGIRPRG
jgi:MFS family permease